VLDLFQQRGLDAWIYHGADWLVRGLAAAHVDQEAGTVRFRPTVVADYRAILASASRGEASLAKIVGVSDDLELVARVADEARELIGDHASVARSQPYLVDVTHPDANEGVVVDHLSRTLGIRPPRYARLVTCRTMS